MTRTLDTAAAARLAGTTTVVVRNWCRAGIVAAVKTGRRWTVELASLLRRLNAARPRLSGWLRRGERMPVRTGRALRRYEARHAARHAGRAAEHPYGVTGHHEWAVCAAANAGRTLAVDYLLAIGFPEAERYASAFSRAVAKQYRKTHGEDPYKGCLVVVRGRIQRVFDYADLADLYAGAYSYQRTRDFLLSRRSGALHELVAA